MNATTTTPTNAASTATAVYYLTMPVTLYKTINVEAPAGLSKDELCDRITWEDTANQELFKDERVSVLHSLEHERSQIDVESELID
jgi:hypothetical protein